VLDVFSRCIIVWKLCTNTRAEDVTDTLDLGLKASMLGPTPFLRRRGFAGQILRLSDHRFIPTDRRSTDRLPSQHKVSIVATQSGQSRL